LSYAPACEETLQKGNFDYSIAAAHDRVGVHSNLIRTTACSIFIYWFSSADRGRGLRFHIDFAGCDGPLRT